MSAIPYFEPARAQTYGQSPLVGAAQPAQNATWRRGNFLIMKTTGSIVTPAPAGAGVSTLFGPAGPSGVFLASTSSTFTVGRVTVVGATASGAPQATYYCYLTDASATPTETQAGPEMVINCAAGIVPRFTVSATGAAPGTTGSWLYVGIISQYEAQQGSLVAFGSNLTVPNPLTNNIGLAQAATNVANGIVGMAQAFSTSNYFSGSGGSAAVGEQSLFGVSMDFPPLTPQEAQLGYFDKLQGENVEISLVQAWSPTLVGTTVGILLDPATGFHVADNSQSNKVATIVGKAEGPAITSQGGITGLQSLGIPGDTGARVIIQFIAADLS